MSYLKWIRSDVRWVFRNFSIFSEIGWHLRFKGNQSFFMPDNSILLRYSKRLVIEANPRKIQKTVAKSDIRNLGSDFFFEGHYEWPYFQDNLGGMEREELFYEIPLRRCIEDQNVLNGKKSVFDLEVVQKLIVEIEKGVYPIVNGKAIRSAEHLQRYLQFYLDLAKCILIHGYDSKFVFRHIGVIVDQNGELIKFTEGRHRLIISQALRLEKIPVEVRAVHKDWFKRCCGKYDGSALNALKLGLDEIRERYN